MRQVAKANNVLFVDLFEPSQRLFAEAAQRGESLTLNGLHLTERGDRLLSEAVFKDLFGAEVPFKSSAGSGNLPLPSAKEGGEGFPFERLREAVNEKNANGTPAIARLMATMFTAGVQPWRISRRKAVLSPTAIRRSLTFRILKCCKRRCRNGTS